MLFNPKKAQFDHLDERSREIMKKTIVIPRLAMPFRTWPMPGNRNATTITS